MKLTDLVAEIAKRCPALDTERGAALLSDLRACGYRDGPDLQTAFDAWRTGWDKRVPPTAAEFRSFSAPAAPKGKDGSVNRREQFEFVAKRRPELLSMALADFDARYPGCPARWRIEQTLRRMTHDLAQAEYLHDRGEISERGFAKYGWKISDEQVAIEIETWKQHEARYARLTSRTVPGFTPAADALPASEREAV